jgi:7-cyano-7-deazaguanine synthase
MGLSQESSPETPLMWIDKAATFALAKEIGEQPLLDLVIEETHSCYRGDRTRRHAWGYGCGECPACRLRAEGFAKFMQRGR